MEFRKIIWQINQNLNKVFKTSFFDELYWKYRLNFEGDWKEGGYPESWKHPHRNLTIKILEALRPESILELGCNTGPNLVRIKNSFPNIKLAGIDISKRAIKEAKKIIPEVDLRIGMIDSLPWPDKSFDVVLVDAVLMYVGPDKIEEVMGEMKRVAKKAIIIIDFHIPDGYKFGEVKLGHWARDYTRWFNKVKIKKITEDLWPDSYSWKTLGYFIIATL